MSDFCQRGSYGCQIVGRHDLCGTVWCDGPTGPCDLPLGHEGDHQHAAVPAEEAK